MHSLMNNERSAVFVAPDRVQLLGSGRGGGERLPASGRGPARRPRLAGSPVFGAHCGRVAAALVRRLAGLHLGPGAA